jgi:transposase, IS6 family
VFARDGLRSYAAAIRELKAEGEIRSTCRQRTHRYANNPVESGHRHVKHRLRTMQWPRSKATTVAIVQGIEAAQMIRKGQVLGIARHNLFGQAWVFGALLGVTA